MIVTTTESICGREITEYIGLVSARQMNTIIMTSKIGDKMFAEIVKQAEGVLSEKAAALDADAVVGVRFCPADKAFYLVGTAVRLSR